MTAREASFRQPRFGRSCRRRPLVGFTGRSFRGSAGPSHSSTVSPIPCPVSDESRPVPDDFFRWVGDSDRCVGSTKPPGPDSRHSRRSRLACPRSRLSQRAHRLAQGRLLVRSEAHSPRPYSASRSVTASLICDHRTPTTSRPDASRATNNVSSGSPDSTASRTSSKGPSTTRFPSAS